MSSYSYLKRKMAKKTLIDLYTSSLPQLGAPGGTAGVGKVFFVNGSTGSNSAQGYHDSPFKTITYALTKCTLRNDDTIIVTRDTTEPAYPVVINKRDIHIFGWCEPNRLGAEKIYYASSDAAGFTVSAQNVEIAGFDMCADSSNTCIDVGAAAGLWNCSIHDCIFGMRGAARDGVRVPAGQAAPYLYVYDCLFENSLARDGIRFEGNATRGWFGFPGHGNVFRLVDGIGIDAIAGLGVVLGGICDNVFLLPSDTAGKAISFLNSGSHSCMVNGNSAFYGKAAMATNPYRDLGSNHWGLNYRQGLSILPAII